MTKDEIKYIAERQKTFFLTGATLPVKFRLEALKKLRTVIKENQRKLQQH